MLQMRAQEILQGRRQTHNLLCMRPRQLSTIQDKEMSIDKHHLLPNQPAPLYATVTMAEYQTLQKKLDICQKECIRIAELYQRDKQLFNKKIQRIIRHIEESMNA